MLVTVIFLERWQINEVRIKILIKMKNTKDVAKLLANRINQEHYILHYLNKIYYAGVKKGKEQNLKDL